MIRPLHETMRAAGQGILCGTIVAVPLALAAAYLGPGGFVAAALATGAGLITIANALKRRDQRKRGGAR
jgi:heme O synthase-like polyprenyltransferase